jgi:CubicO group peptidase (beta-lactamase class C family)
MKKAIATSLVVLLFNSVSAFVFAQGLPAAADKDFTAAYDAQVSKTLATFPDLPGIAIVVIKDDKPIFVRAYGMADKGSRHQGRSRHSLLHRFFDEVIHGADRGDAR